MVPRLRRAFVTTAGILIVLLLAGATYQGTATALERRQFPHPGQLVDVGGRQLHIFCVGRGSPTVILEAPATGMSAAWGWVQPAVARHTRVCSYDRAGLGWSEAGDTPYDPGAVPDQLHALLERSGEAAPYVIVGEGLGAAFATMYASRFGSTGAALVLIDPQPDAVDEGPRDTAARLANSAPWLARTGMLRATRLISNNAAGLPPDSAGALAAFLNRPDHLTRSAQELSRWKDAIRLAAESPVSNITVTRENVHPAGQTTFLSNEADAARATAAIDGAVQHTRTGH
jgi:pimeloyl-ACP methyl ester carboxylesterase